MKLTHEAFARAREFLHGTARPLERALFALEFEAGSGDAVREALSPFRNDDGGFGHGLEPDLVLPESSVLCTTHALHVLEAAHVPVTDAFVAGAVDWLVAAHDPELAAWRSVPEQAEHHPHADHWVWALHADGKRWPVGVLPRAEVLSHLHRSADRVPEALLADQTARLVADFERADPATLGADALLGCERFVKTSEAPRAARDALAARLRATGEALVCRDPERWHSYVAWPLKLAPTPQATLAEALAPDVQRNLDYQIAHQQADGSWAPCWSWSGYADAWALAERAWRGHLTLEALHSLRAYGRIEAIRPHRSTG